MQGRWVQSLVRELRSCMPFGVAKNKNSARLTCCYENSEVSEAPNEDKEGQRRLFGEGNWAVWEVIGSS